MDAKRLKEFANERFSNQSRVLHLWQTLAENFYPERADFTFTHNIGEELGEGLASSQPSLIRRELANSFSAMLRQDKWFMVGVEDEPDHLGKMWLEFASGRLLKLINNRSANFIRSSKEGDHDYATFGQAVISVELNKLASGLLFRSWHMRDCAWWDDDEGKVAGLIRKWAPYYHECETYFGMDAMHPSVQKQMKKGKSAFKTLDIRHFDIPSKMYGDPKFERFPFVSIFFDMEHGHLIKAEGKKHKSYVVPRFQTIAGSPYAYSPATVVGLPDARTLQAMTHTLLEAGERAARPPIIATENVIRGDANLYPDGITFVSEDYDEKMGSSLRPLDQNMSGIPLGMDMRDGIVDVLQQAFYVNRIDLPDRGGEMTAYEFSERMKMYRRQNLPLFAPIEHEYNGQLCELAFDIAMDAGLIGSPYDIPESLNNQEAVFKFESPLSESEEEKKAQVFSHVAQLLGEAAQFDESVTLNVNFDEALRDAVTGAGAPAKWLEEVEAVKERKEQLAEQQQQAAMMEAQSGGTAAVQ